MRTIFVPAAFRRLERGRPAADTFQASRALQDELRLVLRDTYGPVRGHGVIGLDAGRDLSRFPSDVYWGALRTLGIQRQVHDSEVVSVGRIRQGSEAATTDDGQTMPGEAAQSTWDARFPYHRNDSELFDAKGKWRQDLRFDLPVAEAEYLRGCYSGEAAADPAQHKLLSTSLMAHLLKVRHPVAFKLPWDVPPTDHLRVAVAHARWLSAFAAGTGLHYAFLLGRLTGKQDVAEMSRERFGRWWRVGGEQVRAMLAQAFVDDPFVRSLLRARGAAVLPNDWTSDRAFLLAWASALERHTQPDVFLADTAAAALIERRELACKGPKCRLRSERYRSAWNGGVPVPIEDAYLLDYRSKTASLFLQRILAPLAPVPHG